MEAFISSAVIVGGSSTDEWAMSISFCARDEMNVAQAIVIDRDTMR
jgi:hypothetical protein